MVRPALPHDVAHSPERCPECGGRRLGPVRPEDIEVAPLDPEDAPTAYPGMLECRDCGAIVRWEP